MGSLYSGGTLLKQNDDGGSNGNFLITYNVTAGRVYEIRVRAFSSSTDGTATLSLSGSGEVADGGYTAAGNKTSVTFGAISKPIHSTRSGAIATDGMVCVMMSRG